MFPLRLTLLVMTLGLAALLGWLRQSSAPCARVAAAGPIVDGRQVPPPHTPPLRRHLRRSRAAADPSPDEFEPVVVLDDADDDQDGDDGESVRPVPPAAPFAGATESNRLTIVPSSRRSTPTPLFLTLGRLRC
jgi:hypothetical protein